MSEKTNICTEKNKKECKYIINNYQYSPMGWILLLIGISARPTRLIRKCSKCHETIEDINDLKKLREHIGK